MTLPILKWHSPKKKSTTLMHGPLIDFCARRQLAGPRVDSRGSSATRTGSDTQVAVSFN